MDDSKYFHSIDPSLPRICEAAETPFSLYLHRILMAVFEAREKIKERLCLFAQCPERYGIKG
jgi:hypothetical protein